MPGRVRIMPDPVITETSGGIIIPEPSRSRNQIGTVLAVGEGVDEVCSGQRVKYERNAGLPLEDGSFLVFPENILYIIDVE